MQFTIYTSDHQGQPTRMDYPFTAEVTDIDTLIEATRKDHTTIDFDGRNRGKKNFVGSNCLVGDIDNAGREPNEWITLTDLIDAFGEYAVAVTPSRNHMRGKGEEEPRPKWHLYFPIPYTDNYEKFERMTVLLHDRFPDLGFDANVKDAARFFFGHNESQIDECYFNDGKPISSAFKGRPKGSSNKTKPIPWQDMTLSELSENPEVIPSGDRYKVHLELSMFWANQGLSVEEIETKIIEFNNQMPEPRPMYQESVRLQTRALAESAVKKIETEGGPRPDSAFKKIRNYEIRRTELGPVREAIRSTSKEMRAAMEKFVTLESRSGKGTLTLRENPKVLITTPAELSAVLEQIGYVWDVRAIPGALTKEDILVRFREYAEKIDRMTCVPEHDMAPGTLFVPMISFPEPQSTGAFREFLENWSFKSPEDLHRFAAGMLSIYLPTEFDGKVPMFALLADAQNAGKSTVVRESIKMICGVAALEQKGGKENQSDDHAQFSGVAGLASKGVLYDNLTNLSKDSETEIARAITDEYRSAWIMNVSRAHIRNSYTYFATFNDSEGFGRDLQERIIAIRMMNPDDMDRHRRDQVMSNLKRFKARRDQIIADVRYLIGITEEADTNCYIPMQKTGEWAARIVPALQAMFPEVPLFDFSTARDDHRISPQGEIFREFSEFLFTTPDFIRIDYKNSRRFVEHTTRELFELLPAFSPEFARSFKFNDFARTLKEAGRDTGKVKIDKKRSNSTKGYVFSMKEGDFQELKKEKKGENKPEIAAEY